MIDYKKKYLDALERANSFQEKYGGDYAGYIFPELRESEDERIRKELVALFIEVRNREGNEGYWHDLKVADILAYLEKQKEQKPAEWSEEDEKQIRQIERIVKNAGCTSKLQEKIHNWLESLRPQGSKDSLQTHWKPSEEQIYSLGTVVKGAGENSVGSVAYNLKELYEQLKRLKEDEQ